MEEPRWFTKQSEEKLTPEQAQFACECVSKWMQICEENGRGTSWVDVDHSALLRRILTGGKIYDKPPPVRFSYPAWELMEYEEVEVIECFDSVSNAGCVIVDQCPDYVWVEKNKILRYAPLGIDYHYSEREMLPKCIPGVNPEDHKYIGKFLQRIKNDKGTAGHSDDQ